MLEDTIAKITILLNQYSPLFPLFLVAGMVAFILTPLAGRLALKIGAVDLPGHLRHRSDATAERRIHEAITPYFGGLAMFAAFMFTLIVFNLADPGNERNILGWGILLALAVVFTYTLIDDVFGLSFKWQLLGQFIAATIVVLSGITISAIDIPGLSLNFASSTVPVLGHNFIFPADLITIFWIVAIINFVNWVGGIDGLNGSVSAIAAFAILLIAMRSGRPDDLVLAMVVSAYLGSNLGVLPYNYPPAHVYYGAIGDHINGFLLAIFPLLGESTSKLPTAIIVLGLPILDAIWVIITRIRLNGFESRSPWKIFLAITKSDRNHLHHRLLDVGYSRKMVLYIEVTVAIILSTVAYTVKEFRSEFLGIFGSISVVLILFILIGIYRKRSNRLAAERAQIEIERPTPKIRVVQSQPSESEEKFVY